MSINARTEQTKSLGWYAVQRVRVADWIKPRRSKLAGKGTAQSSGSPSDDDETNKSNADASSDKKHGSQKISKEAAQLAKPSATSSDAKKLQAVVRESHTILAKAHSVFPLQLFPDSVNIDRHKLTIVRRHFFGMEQKVSVPLENVRNIEADLGPFFGSITVTSDLFINNTQEVHSLWRDDAKKLQKLVQGAVVAQGEGIDLNKIDVKQLRSLLIDLGSGHTKSM